MRDTDRVERVVVLEADVHGVWAALTRADRLSAWIGAEVDLDVRPGGRGMARRSDGALRRIRVEAVEPPHRLAFRWWPFEDEHEPGMRPGTGTRVEFLLEEVPDGTRLTVVESGWPGRLPVRPPAEVSA